MRIPRLARVAVLASLLSSAAPSALAGPAPPEAEAVRRAFVHDLEELVRWCRSHKLFGRRDDAYALILRVDPEHAEARQRLDYERDAAGLWVQSPRFKPGTNWSPGDLPRYDERLRALLVLHRERLVPLLAAAKDAAYRPWAVQAARDLLAWLPGDPAVGRALSGAWLETWCGLSPRTPVIEREALRALLVEWAGTEPAVRAALGEVELGGAWAPREAVSTAARRPLLAEAAVTALEAVGDVGEGELGAAEKDAGLAWTAVFRTRHARVLGTSTRESLAALARASEAAGGLFRAAFGLEPARPAPLTLYVLAGTEDLRALLGALPGLDPAYASQVLGSPLKGFALGNGAYVIHGAASPETELDMGALATFDTLLKGTLGGPSASEMRGWIYEGLSRYLTWRLVGTRLSVTAGGRYGPPTSAGAGAAHSGLGEALALVEKGEAPELRLLLGKRVEGFARADSLMAYALAAYLVEGRPEEAAAFVRQMGETAPDDGDGATALGETLDLVEYRLRRWLAWSEGDGA